MKPVRDPQIAHKNEFRVVYLAEFSWSEQITVNRHTKSSIEHKIKSTEMARQFVSIFLLSIIRLLAQPNRWLLHIRQLWIFAIIAVVRISNSVPYDDDDYTTTTTTEIPPAYLDYTYEPKENGGTYS